MNENRYLLFYVGAELYGVPLLDVKEVIEYQIPKPVPNMVSHFSGVINLRGAIIGVLDLRKKLGVPADCTRTTAMLICETEQGVLAAVIDRVDSVTLITADCIDTKAPVQTSVKSEYLSGIARVFERAEERTRTSENEKEIEKLVVLVSLKNLIANEELVRESA